MGEEHLIRLPDEASNLSLHIRLLKVEDAITKFENNTIEFSKKLDTIIHKLEEQDFAIKKKIALKVKKHKIECGKNNFLNIEIPNFKRVFIVAACLGTIISGILYGIGQIYEKNTQNITNGGQTNTQQK